MTKAPTKRGAETRRAEVPTEVSRAEIARRGMTVYAVGKTSGADVSILQRFLAGERHLSLKAFDKVCVALGMGLRNLG